MLHRRAGCTALVEGPLQWFRQDVGTPELPLPWPV